MLICRKTSQTFLADVFLKLAHKNIFAYRKRNTNLIQDILTVIYNCVSQENPSCFKNVFTGKQEMTFHSDSDETEVKEPDGKSDVFYGSV